MQLERLELQRTELETERDEKRAVTGQAREQADAARAHARELLIQLEGRRSSEVSLAATLSRMQEQRDQLTGRQEQLELELGDGDEPVQRIAVQLNDLLARRLEVEAELGAARRDLESVEGGTARAG